MGTVATPTAEPRRPVLDEMPHVDAPRDGGGAGLAAGVRGASQMSPRCESTGAVAIGSEPVGDLEGLPREHLLRVGRPEALPSSAWLRVRDRDLVICDGAG